ncbi:MAG: MurR/RpiR family transcriptional regulator [bacterium]|nr:MurR/RpiR family transcriptional regulator [bacterium]
MNPFQLMELHKDQFTPNDLLIYETIMKNPASIVRMTTSNLAEACGVSQPALSRFVKGLGYTRYLDFRTDLSTWLAQQTDLEASSSHHLGYFHTLYQVLDETEKLLTHEYMEELAAYINSFGHVYATGTGKSFHPAELLEILSRKHKKAIYALRQDYINELGDFMENNDLLIVFSVSGRYSIMKEAANANGKLLLVTANPLHEYRESVDRTVLLPYVMPDPETSSISPVLFDIFTELLVSYLVP